MAIQQLYRKVLAALNSFYDLRTGGSTRPVFYDIADTCPALIELDKNFAVIRGELDAVLPRKAAIPRYHELDPAQYKISGSADRSRDWKVFLLYAMGEKPAANRALCPRTSALLDQVPGLFQAFFSILDGGKNVPAHCGPYRGYLRYHLGLKVPERNPPSIRIKDQIHTWREGQSILFDDSWEHEVTNASDDVRVVLIVDILRPMPWMFHAVNVAMSALIRRVYAKRMLAKLQPFD